AQKRLEGSGGIDNNVPVLVRREQDRFYYCGTVKEEIKSERGMFLVELAKPLVSHGRQPVRVQKTAKDDILEHVSGMKHSLLPGGRVLAPWEPDGARYGPGTVLTGIETRDPLRGKKEDEEIMVQFWNDKQVKVPRGVDLWIPPSLWERIVEMIHMLFTSRVKPRPSQATNSSIFPGSPKPALIPVCVAQSLAKHCLLCSPCWPHLHHHCDGAICCLSACVRCFCCCHPCGGAWWPLPSRQESSSEPSPCLLELEDANQGETAAVASPSSDSEWDPKPSPAKNTLGDSAVNTDPSCLEKPSLKDSARPEGKYWKRSCHKSHSKPGSCSSTSTKGQLESKAISTGDTSSVVLANQSTMFKTITQPPRGQLTVNEILRDQDFKPSLRVK
uniref:Chromosome 11 open reading frame 16 n=1 Tax=Malurus cyaneus samueli TaxID=2593467 RepID=A0A8C5X5D1_9PASS